MEQKNCLAMLFLWSVPKKDRSACRVEPGIREEGRAWTQPLSLAPHVPLRRLVERRGGTGEASRATIGKEASDFFAKLISQQTSALGRQSRYKNRCMSMNALRIAPG